MTELAIALHVVTGTHVDGYTDWWGRRGTRHVRNGSGINFTAFLSIGWNTTGVSTVYELRPQSRSGIMDHLSLRSPRFYFNLIIFSKITFDPRTAMVMRRRAGEGGSWRLTIDDLLLCVQTIAFEMSFGELITIRNNLKARRIVVC